MESGSVSDNVRQENLFYESSLLTQIMCDASSSHLGALGGYPIQHAQIPGYQPPPGAQHPSSQLLTKFSDVTNTDELQEPKTESQIDVKLERSPEKQMHLFKNMGQSNGSSSSSPLIKVEGSELKPAIVEGYDVEHNTVERDTVEARSGVSRKSDGFCTLSDRMVPDELDADGNSAEPTHEEAVGESVKSDISSLFESTETRMSSNLRSHSPKKSTQVIRKEEPKKYFCTICSTTFTNKSHLKRHEHNKHSQSETEKQQVHGQSETQKQQKHGQSETQKQHTCVDCKRDFCSKSSLKRHMLIHTGKKQFHCPVCDMRFRRQSTMAGHMSFHTKQFPHTCKSCNKNFIHKASFDYHMLKHHGQSRELPNICQECNKSFPSAVYLKRHTLAHIGVVLLSNMS